METPIASAAPNGARPVVRLERDGAVAELVLDRPHRRNAMDGQLRQELLEAVRTIEADRSVRAVILRGEGGHFCSGGDLVSMQDDPDAISKRQRLIDVHRSVAILLGLDVPVIAVAEGAVYGAGLGLALTADILLVTPTTRLSCAFLRIGMVPDFGVFYTLPRAVGLPRAKELIYSAREFSGEEARAMGLALEVLQPDSILLRARAMARAFCAASPAALSLSKRALGRSLHSDAATMLAIEADAQALAYSSEDTRQAIAAFLAKRPPAYRWPQRDEGLPDIPQP